jgi:hypothetical protein
VRRYSIQIDGGPTFDSQVNGLNDPGAALVVFDVPVVSADLPMGGALISIWGISQQMISQQTNLKNKNIKVFGGFGPGLPLANPKQYGLLFSGYIFNAYANWEGVNQTLDLIIFPGSAPTSGSGVTKNLSQNWPTGQLMSDAIKNTLNTAYPNYTININISPNLKFQGDLPGIYQNLTQYSQYIKQASKAIINDPNYQGVSITLQGTTFTVFDGKGGSSPASPATPSPTAIAFVDLIGQPTWIAAPNIQFKCAMRADLKVGDQVTLPKTQVNNTAAATASLVNQNVAFQGTFQIQSMRHIGNSRQPDAQSWVTVFEAFPLQQQQAAA